MKFRYFILSALLLIPSLGHTAGLDGVDGSVVLISPAKDSATSRTGKYSVHVGDLILIKYGYAVVPGALPTNQKWEVSDKRVVNISSFGVRNMQTRPQVVGSGALGYYFEARKEGESQVTITVNDRTYQYTFEVSK